MREPEVIVKEALFSLFGSSVTEGGVTFTYYDEPPLNPSLPMIWAAVTTLAEPGDKDEFRALVQIEATVVAKVDSNFPTKTVCRLGGEAILGALVTRGQFDWAISVRLTSTNQGDDVIGQDAVVFKKYNLQAIVPCGPVFDDAELYRRALKRIGLALESIECVRESFEALEVIE